MDTDLTDLYGEEYFRQHEAKTDPGVWYGIGEVIHKTYPSPEPRRILEFGCGRGYITQHLAARYGKDTVIGLDVSDWAVNHPVREGLDLRPLWNTGFSHDPDPHFGLLVSWQVMEHLHNERNVRDILDVLSLTRAPVQIHSIYLLESESEFRHDPTHTLLRPRAWWITAFRAAGYESDDKKCAEMIRNGGWDDSDRAQELFCFRKA